MELEVNLGKASDSSEAKKNPRGRPKRGSANGSKHPTRRNLLATTIQLFEEFRAEDLTIEQILQASGVSKGSLYHHFRDGQDLIDEALLTRYAIGIDDNIAQIESALSQAHSKEEAALIFRAITRDSQRSNLRDRRSARMALLLRADNDKIFAERLAREQKRLTDALKIQIEQMQARGWLRTDIDAEAGALLIQAYSIGRRAGQITEDLVSEEKWNDIINKVIEQGLIGLTHAESKAIDASESQLLNLVAPS